MVSHWMRFDQTYGLIFTLFGSVVKVVHSYSAKNCHGNAVSDTKTWVIWLSDSVSQVIQCLNQLIRKFMVQISDWTPSFHPVCWTLVLLAANKRVTVSAPGDMTFFSSFLLFVSGQHFPFKRLHICKNWNSVKIFSSWCYKSFHFAFGWTRLTFW